MQGARWSRLWLRTALRFAYLIAHPSGPPISAPWPAPISRHGGLPAPGDNPRGHAQGGVLVDNVDEALRIQPRRPDPEGDAKVWVQMEVRERPGSCVGEDGSPVRGLRERPEQITV